MERAIKTFKNHFLSVLATADKEYPITEWDRLLPQAEMTLNLMRAARCNPKLLVYTYLHGLHNFATTSLAPAGTKVVIHKKTQDRFFTGREIITDTLQFIPQKNHFSLYVH